MGRTKELKLLLIIDPLWKLDTGLIVSHFSLSVTSFLSTMIVKSTF